MTELSLVVFCFHGSDSTYCSNRGKPYLKLRKVCLNCESKKDFKVYHGDTNDSHQQTRDHSIPLNSV